MAKPKRDLVIRDIAGVPHVWCKNHESYAIKIQEIEGVQWVFADSAFLCVFVCPRYDIQDIIDEIEDIVLGKVPDVFLKESFDEPNPKT